MPEKSTPDGEGRSTHLATEPLTRREREILALLAEGLTSPEIAGKLTLATSSVKSHMQHLYGKLGANSKRQAVARARELGLLGTPVTAATSELQADKPIAEHHSGPLRAIGLRQPLPTSTMTFLLADRATNNLPVPLTSFIGREHAISEATRLLHKTRLLTLTGPGGTGKTRLALQLAGQMLAEFPHGTWLVELAPIAEPGLVPQAVAQALALRAETGRPLQQTLAVHLRDQTVLLVLDNCEHLV